MDNVFESLSRMKLLQENVHEMLPPPSPKCTQETAGDSTPLHKPVGLSCLRHAEPWTPHLQEIVS